MCGRGTVGEGWGGGRNEGAVGRSAAGVGVAVTGVGGPSGGGKDKPVGTVWFGFLIDGELTSETRIFPGDRAAVRAATVRHALEGLVRRPAQRPEK